MVRLISNCPLASHLKPGRPKVSRQLETLMEGIAISPNLRRTKEQIDVNGNIVKPFTKEVIKSAEEGNYIPTKEELAAASSRKPPTEEEILKARQEIKEGIIAVPNKKNDQAPPSIPESGPLGDMITKKIEEKIGNAIADAIGNINIEKLVSDAIEKHIK